MAKVFHELVSVDDVLGIVGRYLTLKPLGVEVVGLGDVLWRVVAEDIYALVDVPPFDRSEVDGFCVVSSDVVGVEEDRPAVLKVVGVSKIGSPFLGEVRSGEAVEVDTGAVVPRGADAVVMVEYCSRVGDSLYVYRSVAPGENIAYAGSDVMRGELVISKGTLITPKEVPILAALGLKEVKVFKKPRVAVISIGSELRGPGEVLGYGEVYDVNTYSISALLRELGINPVVFGVVRDDYGLVRETISKALDVSDVVITSGGTSAGVTDITYRVIDDLGEPGVIIHGLKVRPGKPTVIGVVGSKLVVGLPGFPLSAIMIFNLVVKPLLLKLMGIESIPELKVKSLIAEKVVGGRGREYLIPVILVSRGRELIAYPIPYSSGSSSVFAVADGFIRIPEKVGIVNEGEEVTTYLLSSYVRPADLVIMGSHDYGVNIALNLFRVKPHAKVVNVGSLAGLIAVGKGGADIAGIHLLDERTNTYNVSYVKSLGLEGRVVLIRGYVRGVGLIVPKGNPKGIRGVKDLLRSDVVFMNRNRGSGTRTLLDILLKELAKELNISFQEVIKGIRGYTVEAKTHTAVAAAVAQGRADVGLGIKAAADMYGLDFIELRKEHYDFVVNVESMEKPVVKEFINVLRSEEFKYRMSMLGGYEVQDDVGTIIK